MKKLLTVLFTVFALSALFAVASSADGVIKTSVREPYIKAGEYFTVDVSLEGDVGVTLGRLEIDYAGKPLLLEAIYGGSDFDVYTNDFEEADRISKIVALFEAPDVTEEKASGYITSFTFKAIGDGDVTLSVTLTDAVDASGRDVTENISVNVAPIRASNSYASFEADGKTVYAACDGGLTLPECDLPGFAGWLSDDAFLPAGKVLETCPDGTAFRAVTLGVTAGNGASLRLGEKTGLRFLTYFDRADFEALSEITEVSLGTLIVPDAYAEVAGGISFDADLPQYLDVKSNGFYAEDENALILAGSVTDMLVKNYALKYAAAGYAEFAYSDGTTGRVCSEYMPERSRSVTDVAAAALRDVSETSDAIYVYPTENGFSPYSDADRAILTGFLDAVPQFETKDGKVAPVSDGYYTSPYVCETSESDGILTLTVYAENLPAVLLDGVRVSTAGAVISEGKITIRIKR